MPCLLTSEPGSSLSRGSSQRRDISRGVKLLDVAAHVLAVVGALGPHRGGVRTELGVLGDERGRHLGRRGLDMRHEENVGDVRFRPSDELAAALCDHFLHGRPVVGVERGFCLRHLLVRRSAPPDDRVQHHNRDALVEDADVKVQRHVAQRAPLRVGGVQVLRRRITVAQVPCARAPFPQDEAVVLERRDAVHRVQSLERRGQVRAVHQVDHHNLVRQPGLRRHSAERERIGRHRETMDLERRGRHGLGRQSPRLGRDA
mmetsp:Transcript_6059/g.11780  ORF Transcript_6059/g.11780 Transcript_6059/m.11780 type:complete len:259 (-) Transcript_6059:683-1459(-)